ncbi:hypothetical protein VFPFJ_00700 [Purpureocillium lilacinum]|uniref:Uncharacterized protein n=2 Tax=Purpureocillium lilacinum TaxID=33203 RepID=A0A179HAB7_PURLI|nr:hypothetical protein VFPFJ_00700 [Purpureocillium lilacinum]OAQ86628.1 hypothetical protein VFPBJ_00668 [Purpureocillium lilacinum]OAQ94591.1 hypothetical protein VFPFJ_00700 [Purpureocillium lilacinum]PWI70617.1 hypothetical protein PCL_13016 [Purpureocillium lilacinum]GJN67116.1 hypothetical protein PLICBS_001140 [Purpureocillium lilacinum]GJN81057.1 hypothetical protein PLIIFM63780_004589 [Purpureocillium lilacinum]
MISVITRIKSIFKRIASLNTKKTKTPDQSRPTKIDSGMMTPEGGNNGHNTDILDPETHSAVDRNPVAILQPTPHSGQTGLGMDRILNVCESGLEEVNSNEFSTFDFFGASSETLGESGMAAGRSQEPTDPGLGRSADYTHLQPGDSATLTEPGPFLAGEPAMQAMYSFSHGDEPPLPFHSLASSLRASGAPVEMDSAANQAEQRPSGLVPTPEGGNEEEQQGDRIVVGKDTLEDLGLGIPRSISPRTAATRRMAVTAEIARQEEAPPSLPPTEVQPLPDKRVFPRTVHIPNDIDPLVRMYLEQRNNRICEFVGIHERKRNNVAAKRSRVTRLESLGSYERLYYQATAELRFYRLQAVCEGLGGGAWEALTEEQRARWQDYVIREALDNKATNLREKRAAQRQNRTKGAARARGTASVRSAAQKAIIRRAQIAAEAQMPMNAYLSREVDTWLSQRKDMTTEEVLATLDDDITDDWTDIDEELIDPEQMLELLDPVVREPE